jgi:iron complex outermembrane receptor protein
MGTVAGEPGNLITTDNWSVSQQFSDEIQFSGAAFDKKLNWLVGAFFLNEGTAGPDYLTLDLFRPVPPTSATTTFANGNNGVWPIGSLDDTLYSDASKAVFGNVSYNLGDISPFLGHFTLNGGYRYTWDTEGVCSNGRASIALATGKTLAAPYQSVAQCEADKGGLYGGASFSGTANFSAPTYTLGVDYKVNDNVFFYFTTRRGYRAGGLNTPTLAPALAAFQTYQPQTVTDYEIGAHLKWRAGGWFGHFNIAAYTGQYSGLQLIAAGITAQSGIPGVTAQNQPSNTSMTINAGSSVAQGFEFDGSISPFRGLNFTYGGAYLDERYTKFSIPTLLTPFFEATNFTGAPRWSFDAAVQYFLPLDPTVGAISLNARYYYVDQEYQGQALLPAYSLTNININWDHMFGKPIALTLYMDNVFNQTYVQDVILSTASFGVYSGNYGPPRMVGARIRYDF